MNETIATLCGLIFGAIGTLIGVRTFIDRIRQDAQARIDREIAKRSDAQVKEYAAQRDFEHIRRNQDQMKQAVQILQDETEELSKVLIELKILHQSTFHRVESIAARVDSSTGGWTKRE